MKSLFIALTVLSSFFAQAANHPKDVSPEAIKSFERTFVNAREVYWTITENMYKVTFQVAGQYATAYYNPQGTLLVVTRNISSLQLPVVLLSAIKKDLQQQWISELVEVSDESGTHYYVTLEDGTSRQILRSEGTNKWRGYMKLEK